MSMQIEDSITHVEGEVFIRPFGPDGNTLSDPWRIFKDKREVKTARAEKVFSETGLIPLDGNLVVNGGRQVIAYLIGGKDYSDTTPVNDWIVAKASWGVGAEVPKFTDTTLSPQPSSLSIGGDNEILYDGVNSKKLIAGVDWPAPFIVRFESILGADEGVGYLIREYALWTANNTLFARKVFPAIAKTNDYGISFLHKIRS